MPVGSLGQEYGLGTAERLVSAARCLRPQLGGLEQQGWRQCLEPGIWRLPPSQSGAFVGFAESLGALGNHWSTHTCALPAFWHAPRPAGGSVLTSEEEAARPVLTDSDVKKCTWHSTLMSALLTKVVLACILNIDLPFSSIRTLKGYPIPLNWSIRKTCINFLVGNIIENK